MTTDDESLMIAPLLPLPRPRCEVCGIAFPNCAYVQPNYTTRYYCCHHRPPDIPEQETSP